MDVSMKRTAELTCPECGRAFTVDVWLTVDGSARPDLVEAIREGTLYQMVCPHCEHQGTLDAPLLLFQPDEEIPLLFSPARRTTEEEDRQQAAHLLGALKEALGDAWQPEWLAEGLPVVPPEALPAAVSEDPEAALQEVLERTGQDAEALARQAKEPERLAECVREFLRSRTWVEAQRVVEENPVLLSAEADLMLEQMIEVHGDREDEVAYLEDHQALLRRCREVGVEQAFAEKTNEPPGAMRRLLEALSQLPDEQREAVEEILTQAHSYEALDAALEERPELAPVLDQVIHQTVATGPFRPLWAFAQADTREQAADVLEQHPELLSEETESLLADLIEAEVDEGARRSLEERRLFLNRCREVGVAQALAEEEDAV